VASKKRSLAEMKSQHEDSEPSVPSSAKGIKKRKVTDAASSEEDEISATMQQLDLAVNQPKRGRPRKTNEHAELQKLIETAVSKPIEHLATGLERALKLIVENKQSSEIAARENEQQHPEQENSERHSITKRDRSNPGTQSSRDEPHVNRGLEAKYPTVENRAQGNPFSFGQGI
jgi:hypothetical protein